MSYSGDNMSATDRNVALLNRLTKQTVEIEYRREADHQQKCIRCGREVTGAHFAAVVYIHTSEVRVACVWHGGCNTDDL